MTLRGRGLRPNLTVADIEVGCLSLRIGYIKPVLAVVFDIRICIICFLPRYHTWCHAMSRRFAGQDGPYDIMPLIIWYESMIYHTWYCGMTLYFLFIWWTWYLTKYHMILGDLRICMIIWYLWYHKWNWFIWFSISYDIADQKDCDV